MEPLRDNFILSNEHGHQMGMTFSGGGKHGHITRSPRPHVAQVRNRRRYAHQRRRPAAADRENDVSHLGTAARTECVCGGAAGLAMVGVLTTAASGIRPSCQAGKPPIWTLR